MIAFSDHPAPPATANLPAPIPAKGTQGSAVSESPDSPIPDSPILDSPILDSPRNAPANIPADTEKLGDEIARLAAHIHAATYRLLVLIRKFDEGEGWAGGFRSCAHWLSWRTGIAPGPARERVRVAKALARLPLISAAMASGEMSFSKVRALTRKATQENEAALLEVARHATAARTEELIQCWGRVDRLEEGREEKLRHQARFLQLYPDHDGSFRVLGRLDPEVGALLEKALDWATEELYRKEPGREARSGASKEVQEEAQRKTPKEGGMNGPRESLSTFGQRRADALGLVAERALTVPSDEGDFGPTLSRSRSHLFQVVVHVEAADLVTDGPRVVAESALAEVGAPRKCVPGKDVPAGTPGSEYRDRGCRFPGCGSRFTDAHHIVHWADGGETKLDNLILVCKRHHRALHEEGYEVEAVACREVTEESVIGPEITFRFLGPDRRVIPEVPASPPAPPDPVAAMVQKHAEEGIEPHEWTPTPQWHGETLDFGLAIDMFRGTFPRERPRAIELTPTRD